MLRLDCRSKTKDEMRRSTRATMQIRTSIQAGDIGYIIYLHGMLYARSTDSTRRSKGVAIRLGQFAPQYDPRKITSRSRNTTHGSSVDRDRCPVRSDGELRFFLLHPDARGRGLGHQLMNGALAFCREHGFKQVTLWTITELKAAAHLYKQAGFERTERKTHEVWGAMRTEGRYDLIL